ncbi:probable serine/threonine-protein kinase DDB_G0272092 [Acanthaster planci]|uniref:Probable serine/threonine-protein kinase DDB_G0272092 n=1 Tax=Acanthaster planci TaxID=133434 RepID=A0A8B7ZM61_ACAPL|nr:probable serine/threonine-protein kinase DDB_G0272092 [Acanthaster planci]
MTHKKLRRCIQEKTSKAQTSGSNSRHASTLTKPKSYSSEHQKSLPLTMPRKSSLGASSQALRKTLSPRNTPAEASMKKSPNKALSVTGISPSKTTHPNIAPSCLKKILPDHLQGPYPTVDSGDLEYVMTSLGRKVVLGRGNNGEVLLMRRHSDGTLLAVKRLCNKRFRIKYMLQELAAMQAVSSCPFFPKLFGVVDNSSFAQEFLGDESTNHAVNFAAARFTYGLLTAREWLYVCRDIAEGLKALHRTGWVHNDLHVGNAMLCPRPSGSKVGWTAKIIDLGLAYPLQNLPPAYKLTHEEKQCYYQMRKQVAPEIVEGKTQFSTKSDIYSLGKLFLDIAFNSSSLHGLRHLGLACMIRSPAHRPTLSSVLKKLDGLCSKMAKSKLPPLPPP